MGRYGMSFSLFLTHSGAATSACLLLAQASKTQKVELE